MSESNSSQLLNALQWRCIGPPRGGRVVTVAGVPDDPATYYFGAVAGGIWKSNDAGQYWANISDGFLNTSAIGALAVAPSDPNVIYAGTGEHCLRIDVSHGDGVYKSTDAGQSWTNIGLKDTRHISKIHVHPQNSDIVYVAALGHAFGPNEERGVFRSTDGGRNWTKILYKSDKAGAIDMAMDPNNPRILYVSMWEAYRKFWTLSSGGPDSGLWRSKDGGDTWQEISHNPGLPDGILGKIGLAASPARSGRVWAIVEAEDRGVYRTDDGGDTWKKASDKTDLHARPWYFHHIVADPQDENTVYVLSVRQWKSVDSGENWSLMPTPHGDNHALWIDPNNSLRMMSGNDGGACVSFNAGDSWSTIYNQLTAQFYRVTTDNQFPYRVYGTQQDNSSISVPSRTGKGAITWQDCYAAGTGESGHIAVHPENPNIVFVGAIGSSPGGGGALQRYDHSTGQIRLVTIYPENNRGLGAIDWKYRFQWTYPILYSPHDSNVLYATGNHVFKTADEGQSWEIISPDLTRADPETLGVSGGPITKDTTGAENYATIYAFMESAHEAGLFWAGSDDGLVHISRDGGASWQDVTPADLPEWTMIHALEISPHDPGTMYFAGTRYKLDDYAPYLYRTSDYGQSWQKIVSGIPADDFTRVIREDPGRKGLLYAGTETGLYISFNDGEQWFRSQSNLPVTPIHDMTFKNNDLVVATHGRSFWILDDVSVVRQIADELGDASSFLFSPGPVYRYPDDWFGRSISQDEGKAYMLGLGTATTYTVHRDKTGATRRTFLDSGADPDNGLPIHYYLGETPAEAITLTILDGNGNEIKQFSSAKPNDEADKSLRLTAAAGLNRFVWDLRYPDATKLIGGPDIDVRGPKASPGSYEMVLTVGKESHRVRFEILKNPTVSASDADLGQQFDYLVDIRNKQSAAHDAVNQIRKTRDMVKFWQERGDEALSDAASALTEKLTAIEEKLIDSKATWFFDMNNPAQISDKLAGLPIVAANADFMPTQQAREVLADLTVQLDKQLAALEDLMGSDVQDFNRLVQQAGLPAVSAD